MTIPSAALLPLIFPSSPALFAVTPPILGSILHLLLFSNRKRQLPFGLTLILLATGRPLIHWLTRSPPTELNAPDNEESGFPSPGNRRARFPHLLNLVLWWWRNDGHVVVYCICVSACLYLHRAFYLSATSAVVTVRCLKGGGPKVVPQVPPNPHQLLPLRIFSTVYCFGLVCLFVQRVRVGERHAQIWKSDPQICMYVIICAEFSGYSST